MMNIMMNIMSIEKRMSEEECESLGMSIGVLCDSCKLFKTDQLRKSCKACCLKEGVLGEVQTFDRGVAQVGYFNPYAQRGFMGNPFETLTQFAGSKSHKISLKYDQVAFPTLILQRDRDDFEWKLNVLHWSKEELEEFTTRYLSDKPTVIFDDEL